MTGGFDMDIASVVYMAHANSVEKGFWDGPQNFPEKLMLIVSEAAEALEWYRQTGAVDPSLTYDEDGKPVGILFELADIHIRVADLCGGYGMDLNQAIEEKMKYNSGRPHKHGKVC